MGIKMKEQFPASRRADPKRLAEARVYDALANLECNGHGLYEFRYRDDGQQVDFPLWLHGKGRFAIEVKGGRYEMPSAGEWQLVRPDGERTTAPSPVEEAADGAIEMRSAIIEATGFKNFIAAVLLFPDMERDKRIESAARRTSWCTPSGALSSWRKTWSASRSWRSSAVRPCPGSRKTSGNCCTSCNTPGPRLWTTRARSRRPPEGMDSTPGRSSSSTWSTCTCIRRRWRECSMDRQEHIEVGRRLLDLMESPSENPKIGVMMAGCCASGAFAHALMAHSGTDDVETEMPSTMYAAAVRLDREDGGGEGWRQVAFAACELSHHFYFDGLTADELERKTALVARRTAELLDRLDPGRG